VKSDPTFWMVARASGLTAYLLLTLAVLAGLVVKARPFGRSLPPAAVTDVHRVLALLALGAVALHGTALVLDTAVDIPLAGLVVPGSVAYRPIWTGAGVVAAELMLLVYLSFGVRRRIGSRAWRRLHWTTYAVFVLATAHGLAAGTDSASSWALALYGGAVGSVCAAAAWRALVPPEKGESTRVPHRDRSLTL
jgi:sulfoxide reductase heme-binding subunit YedZ